MPYTIVVEDRVAGIAAAAAGVGFHQPERRVAGQGGGIEAKQRSHSGSSKVTQYPMVVPRSIKGC